jgi:hypothetical protein
VGIASVTIVVGGAEVATVVLVGSGALTTLVSGAAGGVAD